MSFVTLSALAESSGRSKSSLQRAVKRITDDPAHEHRELITPTHDAVTKLRKDGTPFQWRVEESLLDKLYPADATTKSSEQPTAAAAAKASDAVTLALLTKTIETLEKQLDRKDDQITHLNERLRESNILLKMSEEQRAIAAPAATPKSIPAAKPAAPKKATPKAKKPTNTKANKRGLFSFRFRKR